MQSVLKRNSSTGVLAGKETRQAHEMQDYESERNRSETERLGAVPERNGNRRNDF